MKSTIKHIIIFVSLPIVGCGFLASWVRAFFLTGCDLASDFKKWIDS